MVGLRIIVQRAAPLQNPGERRHQPFHRQSRQLEFLGRKRIFFRKLGKHPLRGILKILHTADALPDPLVFLQAADQFRFRIFLAFRLRRPGQHGPALDLQQGGGHHQKIAGLIHIKVAGVSDNFEILVRNLADENVPDVDLRLADQGQQQIQRPVKIFQLKRSFHRAPSVQSGLSLCGKRVTGSGAGTESRRCKCPK